MNHDDVLDAIAAGVDDDPTVLEHLQTCDPCTEHASLIQSIVAAAPEVASDEGAPSPELHDRIMSAVTAGNGGAGVTSVLDRLTGPGRQRLLRSAAAAAVVAVVMAGLVLTGDDNPDEPILIAASRALEDASSYRIEVEGSATFTFRFPEIDAQAPATGNARAIVDLLDEAFDRLPPGTADRGFPDIDFPDIDFPDFPYSPDFPGIDFPDFGDAGTDAGPPPAIDPAELRRHLDDAFDQLELDETLSRRIDEIREISVDELIGHAFPTLDELTSSFHYSGAGEVLDPGRLHLAGTIDGTMSSWQDKQFSQPFEVVSVDGAVWLANGDETWTEQPAVASPVAPTVAVDELATWLREASGVEDLGTEDLDGTTVRHLRFDLGADTFGFETEAGVQYRADAWIGVDDDIVRRFDVANGGRSGPDIAAPGLSWETTTSVRLSDFGAAVEISPPAPELVVPRDAGVGAMVIAYPFHVTFRAGLHATDPALAWTFQNASPDYGWHVSDG